MGNPYPSFVREAQIYGCMPEPHFIIMEKISKEEMDWFDKKGNLVILNGIALKNLKKDESLFTYGQIQGIYPAGLIHNAGNGVL